MRIGDTAQRAFRSYARLCPRVGDIGYFELCRRIRGSCRSERDALRLLAVNDTIRCLIAMGRDETVSALEAVYFAGQGRTPRKNEITDRVRRFALAHSMDERTVWRRLDEAKRLYLGLVAASDKNIANKGRHT